MTVAYLFWIKNIFSSSIFVWFLVVIAYLCFLLWKTRYIKNNALVTVNNDFWSWVGWFANDFRHSWKSLANHLTSDHKIVIQGNECIILFLACYFVSRTHHSTINNHQSLISPLSSRAVVSDFHSLWRHMNTRHWHCDVIFVDCSCTCKLAQRRCSLVNNNREYWFLTTRYLRLSM